MFTKKSQKSFKPLIDGVLMKPLVHEEKSLLCEFLLKKGYSLPAHKHPYEQTGYLISGKLNFRIDSDWYSAEPGDSWCVPENVEHEVIVLEESVAVEVFIPVREEYLKI
ncbi:MAG: cupin domain-containing protein [Prolixibacteraceae bacterium]|nr:cupin domain-containing protein [Prolixibacteraceae bacterium]